MDVRRDGSVRRISEIGAARLPTSSSFLAAPRTLPRPDFMQMPRFFRPVPSAACRR
jgi:hypothetical protein